MNKRFLFRGSILLIILIFICTSNILAKDREEIKIALVTAIAQNPFFVTMDAGARTAAHELGVSYEYQGPSTFSFVDQMTIVRSLVSRGIDGILIAPVDSDASVAPLSELVEAGISIICVDTTLAENDIAGLPLTTITSDNVKGGRIAGERLAQIIGEKGKVALMRSSVQLSTDRDRAQGFKEALSEYPDIEIVAEEFGEEQTSNAASQIQTILSAHPDLAGAFGVTTPIAHGVAMGIQAMGKTGEVQLVSYDAQPMEAQDVRDGLSESLIAQAPYMMGYMGAQLLVNHLEGFVDSYCPLILTGFKIITKDNVDDPETQAWLYREKFLEIE
jgi:ribose transport system substrate-binding protein